jgi:hypothetical protein
MGRLFKYYIFFAIDYIRKIKLCATLCCPAYRQAGLWLSV